MTIGGGQGWEASRLRPRSSHANRNRSVFPNKWLTKMKESADVEHMPWPAFGSQ